MVVAKEIREKVKLPGTVRSATTAPVSSKVMGTVQEIRVRAGDRVKTGELLAVIDSRETAAMVQKAEAGLSEAGMALKEIERSLESAQAQLALSKATLKRYEQLLEQKSVSPQEFEEVQTRERSAAASLGALEAKKEQVLARIQQARADIQASQALQSYAQLQSPLDGLVVERQAEPGSLAVPGVPLVTVEANRYRLEVPAEESRLPLIKLHQVLNLQVPTTGAAAVRGRVVEIQPAADPASRTYLIKIDLPSHPQLRSGMYGEAWLEAEARAMLSIEPRGVVRQGQLEGAYVLAGDDRVRFRLLRLGEPNEHGVEVLSGLAGGERYVVEGTSHLHDGSRVEVAR
jgi:RND family efflux transporter MFP subunit